MRDTIFGDVRDLNPNAKALVVPQQEGGVDDDNYFGSIGDATNQHVSSLSDPDRQMWEALITVGSGSIFRAQPNHVAHDNDPMNLRGKDLDNWLMRECGRRNADGTWHRPTKGEMAVLREAIEEEQARREAAEDVYDRSDLLPYDQLEKFPGMMKHVELPKTPKDLLLYMGNTTQIFYDHFPEGHPDQKLINDCLVRLNRDWDDITKDYAAWFSEWIYGEEPRSYVAAALSCLAHEISEGKKDPVALTESALAFIDTRWQEEYHKKANARMESDSVYQLLKQKEQEWEEAAEQGHTVLPRVRAFGRSLYESQRSFNKNEVADEFGWTNRTIRPFHWKMYRRLRDKYAPRVMLNGIDLNRASVQDVRKATGSSDKSARNLWLARPFFSLSEVRARGYLSSQAFAKTNLEIQIVEGMEDFAEKSRDRLASGPLDSYRSAMIKAQREGREGVNWSSLWQYYNLLKEELEGYLEEQRNVGEDSDEEGTRRAA